MNYRQPGSGTQALEFMGAVLVHDLQLVDVISLLVLYLVTFHNGTVRVQY